MAHVSDQIISTRKRGDLFANRYPDFPQWLDGQTWALDVETEIHEPLNAFRASLYYQARAFGLRLATKQVTDADGHKILLVRSYED